MKFRPLYDRVMIQVVEEEEVTKGGIIIPDVAKEKPQIATVISTGSGRVLKDGSVYPIEVKEGDKVLFGKYTGFEIKIDGEEYLVINEDDILGVVGDCCGEDAECGDCP